MLELSLVVFQNSLTAPIISEDGQRICSQALGMVDNLLRPIVPPLVKSMALRQATRDLTGGSILGKEADYVEQTLERSVHLDLHEAEAIQSARNMAETDARQQDSASEAQSRQQDSHVVQPVAWPSSAAPSAQEVNMTSFGLLKSHESFNSPPSVSTSANSTSSLANETSTTTLKRPHTGSSEAASSAAPKQASAAVTFAQNSVAGLEVEDDEEEPALVAGGGRQAELAAVKWDAEDSDTSDDDAPMPKIYMTDDEDD